MGDDNKSGFWPKTTGELVAYINGLNGNGYEEAAEAATLATLAAFNYMAHAHGLTGFQAGWAGMQFISRSRGMEGPWMILDASKNVYPQYDVLRDAREFIGRDSTRQWLADKARENLADVPSFCPSTTREHWRNLADAMPAKEVK